MDRKKKRSLSLYQKFSLTIIMIGLVPMLLLSTFFTDRIIRNYTEAMRYQYEQAGGYVSSSLESMLDSYNSISKMPYYYNFSIEGNAVKDYLSFDNFRKIVTGEDYEAENREIRREADMTIFLNYLSSVDGYISSVHFVAGEAEQKLAFHYSTYSTYFKDEDLFEQVNGYQNIDKSSNKMILIPTHQTGYFSSMSEPVFTVARNYFDLRGNVGNTPYVGTIFIDVSLNRVEQLFRTVKFSGYEAFYIVNEAGDCFYSSVKDKIGINLSQEINNLHDTTEELVISTQKNDYGLKVVVIMNTEEAFSNIRQIQRMMYLCLTAAIIGLLCGSLFFSKRLTKPMHEMMEQMKQVESGNFEIQLPVRSGDEIGILAERFNQMSEALNNYINQSYVAQIKQNEAELTALKSQIYPHFLYNTLEIIRMTALEETEQNKVPEMIEALSKQIHYLIGPMQDMVPLEQEITIVREYIYLLNCRITSKVQLTVDAPGANGIMVPKLILQPIVENAYVHGIKPRKGNGSIMVEASVQGDIQEISVMDNGIGMSEGEVEKIQKLLTGNEPGIKNEYNWQSIGLKNVHDRIRYLYGEKYGIKITSTPKMGTIVRLEMPRDIAGQGTAAMGDTEKEIRYVEDDSGR